MDTSGIERVNNAWRYKFINDKFITVNAICAVYLQIYTLNLCMYIQGNPMALSVYGIMLDGAHMGQSVPGHS